jgi:prefoldin subunit 5
MIFKNLVTNQKPYKVTIFQINMDQQMLLQAVELEKQVRDLEQHSTFINQQLGELQDFYKNLESFSKNKAESMLASLGKGVYVQTTQTKEELFVEVGAE